MVGKLISIVGQTSSGKSDLGIFLAQHFNGEIVSADSRQVFVGMDYCTGKVSPAEQKLVRHHLIDILPTNSEYSVAKFQQDAYNAIDDIIARKKIPFLVGGTGLYVRSVVEGYNFADTAENLEYREMLQKLPKEELLKKLAELGVTDIDPQKSLRALARLIEKAESGEREEKEKHPRYDVLQIGIKWPREQIYAKIEDRLDQRLPNIIKEVEHLMQTGTTKQFLDKMGLEAKLASDYILGKFGSYQEFRDELLKQERHFAKRQDTWLKKEPYTIWLDANTDYKTTATKLIKEFLERTYEN